METMGIVLLNEVMRKIVDVVVREKDEITRHEKEEKYRGKFSERDGDEA